jgi:nucleotide-binding universal stress UspA family protein
MTPGLAAPGPIVVGVERSERSRDALALARALARAAGTRLIIVAVYAADARSAVMERGAYARALAIEAESVLEWVARPLAGVSAEARAVPCSSVPRGLQEIADAEGALAIVVGPSHRGPLGRIVPGSVGERLLHGAPCPVAVAPRGYWGQAYAGIKRIGVGYVPVPEAQDALAAAVGLAARTGAAVKVLSVIEPTAVSGSLPLGSSSDGLGPTVRAELGRSLRRAIEAVPEPIAITGEVADGYADDELARLSREVDLLVCGSRGHSPAGSVMLGCVSAGVLRKARCPVLVVPRGARDGFAALRAAAPTAAVA